MSNRRVEIGSLIIDNPVILAPMAGITDKTFRIIAKDFGVGLIYTEMISAKALSYKNIKTQALLDLSGEKGPIAVQIFGSEPAVMAEAALKAQAEGAAMVDINMGCPVPKVVKNREGSALLDEPELAADIVSAIVKAVNIPVSVKIRLGLTQDKIVAVEFARRMAAAGASVICLHARTREQYYSGKADWTWIKRVKESVSVPVFGNGDIWTAGQGLRMLEETGCDGIMIGRGALGNPWLLGQTVRLLAGEEPGPNPTKADKIGMAIKHMHQLVAHKGQAKGIPEMRKHLAWYLKGLPHTSELKEKLFHCKTMSEAEELLLAYLGA